MQVLETGKQPGLLFGAKGIKVPKLQFFFTFVIQETPLWCFVLSKAQAQVLDAITKKKSNEHTSSSVLPDGFHSIHSYESETQREMCLYLFLAKVNFLHDPALPSSLIASTVFQQS